MPQYAIAIEVILAATSNAGIAVLITSATAVGPGKTLDGIRAVPTAVALPLWQNLAAKAERQGTKSAFPGQPGHSEAVDVNIHQQHGYLYAVT